MNPSQPRLSRRGSHLRAPAVALAWLGLILPAAFAIGTAPALRYQFEPGRKYVYEIKITVTFDDAVETREGLSIFAVKSAAGGEFVLNHSGSISTRRKATGTRPPWARPDFLRHVPWSDNIFVRPGDLTLSAQGRVVKTQAETALPYMLGDLEFLVLEEFPEKAQSRWEQTRPVTIAQRERSRFPRGPFAPQAGSGPRRSALEIVRFSVASTAGGLVRLNRDYELRSEEKVDGNPSLELTGSGEMSFDPKLGAVEKLAMKYTYRANETNFNIRIPITVDCRLLNPQEAEQRLKARDEAQAAAVAAAAKANETKPLEAGEREKLLKDLKSNNEWTVRGAADRLARAPADDRPEEVAATLQPLLSDRSSWVRGAAAKALVGWGTTNSAPALIKAVSDPDLWVRKAAMEALGRLKDPEGARAVAARLVELGDRGDAAKALKAMGAVAEPAVLPYLKDRDGWVRLEACKVLGQVGTAQSLAALEEFGSNGRGFDKPESEKAIQAIKARH